MTDKYELTDNTKEVFGHILYQIRSLKDFRDVKKGDLGGWVENYGNLSQTGTAWVYDNAKVYENAQVSDDAQVYDDALVFGSSLVRGNALVSNSAIVFGSSLIYDNALVYGSATVSDSAKVYGSAQVHGIINICENDEIKDNKSYLIFKNTWSSGREFVYVLSNQRWHVGCFNGTGEELIKKAYADSEVSGKMYEFYVRFAENLVKEQQHSKDKDNVQ